MLNYGMMGDRLSDLVDELMELNDGTYYPKEELNLMIGRIEALRIECDTKVFEALPI